MITIKNIIRFQDKKALFFILAYFQFSFANAIGFKEDSLSNKFPINDPRNPNCPCHKYQKMADDEFMRSFGPDITVNLDKNNSNYENAFNGNSTVNSINKVGTKKIRSRNNLRKLFDLKKKKGSKRKKVRRFRKDNTSCYHF